MAYLNPSAIVILQYKSTDQRMSVQEVIIRADRAHTWLQRLRISTCSTFQIEQTFVLILLKFKNWMIWNGVVFVLLIAVFICVYINEMVWRDSYICSRNIFIIFLWSVCEGVYWDLYVIFVCGLVRMSNAQLCYTYWTYK